MFSLLDRVAVQEPEDADIWNELGISRDRIVVTGSLKFDPGSGTSPQRRAEFADMLAPFGSNRPVVLAASTHAGEEILIARAVREASPEALFAVVPRHAERRTEVRASLEAEGFEVILRSSFSKPVNPSAAVFVIDSTGELRDWTAHADVVVIGKSFIGTGGQNPCEAVIASKPVIFGAHMENFEPLATRLAATGGCLRVENPENLTATLRSALAGGPSLERGIHEARATLARHEGACARTVLLLRA